MGLDDGELLGLLLLAFLDQPPLLILFKEIILELNGPSGLRENIVSRSNQLKQTRVYLLFIVSVKGMPRTRYGPAADTELGLDKSLSNSST